MYDNQQPFHVLSWVLRLEAPSDPNKTAPVKPAKVLPETAELKHGQCKPLLSRLFPARTEPPTSQDCHPRKGCPEPEAFHPL